MSQSPLATVAVIILILLAGCSGFAINGENTSTPTVESKSTNTPVKTAAPSPTIAEYPRGWSESGVQNATVALESHYRALFSGQSTTVRYRSRVITAQNDQAGNTALDMQINPRQERLHASVNGTEYHREVSFSDGTATVWSVRSETVVGSSGASFNTVSQSLDNRILKSHLLLYKLELNDTVRQEGKTAMMYNVTGTYNRTISRMYGSATSGSGYVVVSERGRILAIQTTVTYTGGKVKYQYTQTGIGETEVGSPEWKRNT